VALLFVALANTETTAGAITSFVAKRRMPCAFPLKPGI
jgi:hypothetical protein